MSVFSFEDCSDLPSPSSHSSLFPAYQALWFSWVLVFVSTCLPFGLIRNQPSTVLWACALRPSSVFTLPSFLASSSSVALSGACWDPWNFPGCNIALPVNNIQANNTFGSWKSFKVLFFLCCVVLVITSGNPTAIQSYLVYYIKLLEVPVSSFEDSVLTFQSFIPGQSSSSN